jgi:SNF2 family DNA or RNA helicase
MGYRPRYRSGPVVSATALADYLNRPLESFAWMKKLPRAALVEGLEHDWGDPPPFHSQLVCFNIALDYPQFLYFLDMGAGKTRMILNVVRWKKKHDGVRRVLVLVPQELHVQTWVDQIEEHAPELTYTALLGRGRFKALGGEDTDLYLMNYAGLQLYMTNLVQVSKRSKKRRRELDEKLAAAFAKIFDMAVFDESHRIGNHEALVYRECRRFTRHCRFLYALTGTPFGKDPTKLWAQFHIVDDGETLGGSLGMYRAAFFDVHDKPWARVYEFDKRMKKDLHRMIQHRSIRYEEKELQDLPKLTMRKVRVAMGSSAEEQYANVLRRIKESRGDMDEIKYSFVRMRMVTSGFLSVKSDLGDRLTVEFEHNPKLDALEELLEGLSEDMKAVIFHDYITTGQIIQRMLAKRKWKFAAVNGQVKGTAVQLRSFLRDPSCRFLVANNAVGAEGGNYQKVCHYAFFYESPTSPITRKQAIKRISRTGQEHPTFVYDLVVPKSVDTDILESIASGEDLFDAVCNGRRKMA